MTDETIGNDDFDGLNEQQKKDMEEIKVIQKRFVNWKNKFGWIIQFLFLIFFIWLVWYSMKYIDNIVENPCQVCENVMNYTCVRLQP